MANKPLSEQGLPIEFTYQPTKVLHGPPRGDVIYEQGLGQEGKAPIFPWMQSKLDPLHWSKSGDQSMSDTVHEVVNSLTQMHQLSQTPHTEITKNVQAVTTNTRVETPPGYNKARPNGYFSVEEAIHAQKANNSGNVQPEVQTSSAALLGRLAGKNRGWSGNGTPPQSFLNTMRRHPTTAQQLGKLPEGQEPSVLIAGARLTEKQMKSIPPGLLRVLLKSQSRRMGQLSRPPAAFHPSESNYKSTQYTTRWRPGLVPVAPGMYVRPEQVAYYHQTQFGQITPFKAKTTTTFTAAPSSATNVPPSGGSTAAAPSAPQLAAPAPSAPMVTIAPAPMTPAPAPPSMQAAPPVTKMEVYIPKPKSAPMPEPQPQPQPEPQFQPQSEPQPQPQPQPYPGPMPGDEGPIMPMGEGEEEWYYGPQAAPLEPTLTPTKIALIAGAIGVGGLILYLATKGKKK